MSHGDSILCNLSMFGLECSQIWRSDTWTWGILILSQLCPTSGVIDVTLAHSSLVMRRQGKNSHYLFGVFGWGEMKV